MKTLIVDDDFNTRVMLQKMLSTYGDCEVVINGQEAVEAFVMAHADGEPYDIICLDIMMPDMDGLQSLNTIRAKEEKLGLLPGTEVKIIMITALKSPRHVLEAYFHGGCDDYIVKPVTREIIEQKLREFGFGHVVDMFGSRTTGATGSCNPALS